MVTSDVSSSTVSDTGKVVTLIGKGSSVPSSEVMSQRIEKSPHLSMVQLSIPTAPTDDMGDGSEVSTRAEESEEIIIRKCVCVYLTYNIEFCCVRIHSTGRTHVCPTILQCHTTYAQDTRVVPYTSTGWCGGDGDGGIIDDDTIFRPHNIDVRTSRNHTCHVYWFSHQNCLRLWVF